MTEVRIVAADRQCLESFARVMVDAFTTEGINSYAFDYTRGQTLKARTRAARVELESFVTGGDLVLVACMAERVVGGAIVTSNAPQPVSVRMANALRWLWAVLPLLPSVRWRRLLAVKRATSLSGAITGSYYTLAAVAVHPDLQGRGIGRMLLDEVHRFVERDPNILGAYLYTGDSRNRVMYEHAGYRLLETRRAGELTVYHMFRTNGCVSEVLDVNE